MSASGLLHGKWPAIVDSYDAASRTCEVSIPGQTDGQGKLVAEIEYPIGDKSRNTTQTEIEVLPGDLVWIEFIQGDPRYPLITGWRNPTQGNSAGCRRWHHKNIELLADGTINIEAGSGITLKVGGSTITLTGSEISLLASKLNLNN
ncbi:MAG: hypothetical protein ACRDDA_13020 [Aeromonas sp.]